MLGGSSVAVGAFRGTARAGRARGGFSPSDSPEGSWSELGRHLTGALTPSYSLPGRPVLDRDRLFIPLGVKTFLARS